MEINTGLGFDASLLVQTANTVSQQAPPHPELMACKVPRPQRGALLLNCYVTLPGCLGVHDVAEEVDSL